MQEELNFQLPELTFEVSNLGSVRKGNFTQRPLTVFCGPNNTGKTWVLYSLYGYLELLLSLRYDILIPDSDAAENVDLQDLTPSLEWLNKILVDQLPLFFNSPYFEESQTKFGLAATSNIWAALDFAQKPNLFLVPG